MVRTQIGARGVEDPATLAAMRSVPRHEFVPPALVEEAYSDRPLPIGEGQTISQPYIVAFMTEQLALGSGDKVLEVGTGSGYQAAVLAALGVEVFTIEIVESLARSAEARLARLGYDVTVRHGDGYLGWPEEAPFDAQTLRHLHAEFHPALGYLRRREWAESVRHFPTREPEYYDPRARGALGE